MTLYQIQGPARVCATTGRELRPGEQVYSVLLEEAGQFVRKDYAGDAWPGSPPEAIAHWKGRIPASGQPRKPIINDELLVDCFNHLGVGVGEAKESAQRNFRYIVALLLMRRKRFKFEDVLKRDGEEVILLYDSKAKVRHEVPDPHLTEAEMTSVQDEVFRVLGWD